MATIKLEDNVAHIVLKAISDRMGELNNLRVISGYLSENMTEDYECLEEAYNAIVNGINKAEQVYVVKLDNIPEDKAFSELTDEEVIELSYKHYNSVEGFILDFNAELLDDTNDLARVIIR